MSEQPCPTCNGNGSEMACSYPGENKPGCLHTYITIGQYTLSVVNNKTVSIFMDDGEGGTFRLHDFEATIAEFYRDNYS